MVLLEGVSLFFGKIANFFSSSAIVLGTLAFLVLFIATQSVFIYIYARVIMFGVDVVPKVRRFWKFIDNLFG